MVGRAFYFDSPGTTRQIFKMKSLDSKVVFAANKYKISCCGIAVKDWFFVGIVKKFDVLIRVARIWEIDVGFVISTSSKIYFVAAVAVLHAFANVRQGVLILVGVAEASFPLGET